jgi:hypothetical protein
MTHPDSETTRLAEYSARVRAWAHGHQVKGITTFVRAIIEQQSGTQAEWARGLGNQEARVKRLARLLHNERLAPHRWADAVLEQALRQLPPTGKVRLALDWTSEGSQHLVVVSLLTGGRGVPSYGRAYDAKSRETNHKAEQGFPHQWTPRTVCDQHGVRGLQLREGTRHAGRMSCLGSHDKE